MARSLNQATLIGNLGKDAEMKTTGSGVAIVNFSLATSHGRKVGTEWKDETTWHNIVAFKAENIVQYLTKGTTVCVTGRIQNRSYDDKDGNKRYVSEIVTNEIVLLSKQGGAEQASLPQGKTTGARGGASPASSSDEYDDTVPF